MTPTGPELLASPTQHHLGLHLRRIALMLQRHMRLRAERYLQANGSYSDLCVGPQEMRAFFTSSHEQGAHGWLDELGVASLEAIRGELDALDEQMRALLGDVRGDDIVFPIEEIRAGFMLDPSELDLLLAAAAPRLDVDISRMYTVAWVDFSIRQPTGGFLAEIVGATPGQVQQAMAKLADHASLVRYRLLVPGQHQLWAPQTPRVHAPMEVPQRILDFISGTLLSVAGHTGCTLHRQGLGDDELMLDEGDREALANALRRPRPRVCMIGLAHSGRRTVATALVRQQGMPLLEVDVPQALPPTRPISEVLAEILREARLHHAAVLLRLDDIPERSPVEEGLRLRAPAIRELISEYPGPIFITAATGGPRVDALVGNVFEVTLTAPPRPQQCTLWERALEGLVSPKRLPTIADDLARSYRLVPGTIFRVVDRVREHGGQRRGRSVSAMDLVRSVRRQLDHGLGWLADVVTVPMGLDDLVLDEELQEQIDEILRYAKHSEKVFDKWGFSRRTSGGRGLTIMFSGPPGTGKTLTAGVLARELGRILYRIDLSRIVDKYIGETEKNLSRVFDEAERAQAVLLFDEADSLFAQRTSVKSSNDRYANLEVNFLLQRLDDYTGVSVLTTNFATAIDDAFQRRIRFKVEFPLPPREQRGELWRKLLPPDAPIAENIDWDVLGEDFEFSGGHIRNAVLRAAIQAADSGGPITEAMLTTAARAEAREMGQLVISDETRKRKEAERAKTKLASA